MAMPLGPVALLAGGAVLTYAAIEDPAGGPLQVVRDLLAGKTPTPGGTIQILTTIPHGAGNTPGTEQGPGGEAGGALAGGGRGAAVAAEAMKWLNVPYLFGGATRKGIDCSGLVMVAYKAALGINLPHFATAIGRYGHAVPRAQAAAGDVVLWGTPANYPHCAIAINNTQCIAAWTYGVGVKIKNIDIKAVAGYGYPVIHRLVT